jgi:homospermidine synthase
MPPLEKKVLFLGFGAVAQCTLPIFLEHVPVPPQNVTVMDFEDKAGALTPWIQKGVRFVRNRVGPDNLAAVLEKHLAAGDLLVDLAWNIDCCELLQWCRRRGVLYVNTSVEVWNPYADAERKHPTEKTLYWRQMNIRRLTAPWNDPGPTAVLEHGANPGLISHWTKQGLIDIGENLLADKRVGGAEAEEIRHWIDTGSFNRLARSLGVKVIHCSERDTQISDRPKEVDEFVNTWSIEGFREEGTTTAEMGWGTHERELPELACQHQDGPRNQICLARMGINTWVRSWVPHYNIHGMVVRHGEAFSISDFLTVWEDGRAVYRPTVHYAYCPCDAALVSLQEMRGNDYRLQPKLRIMNDEIQSGADVLGALLMGHAYNAWWTGSDLSIEESRRLVPHQNATTVQVAISVVAAVLWMLANPRRGVCLPDHLPHDFILKIARPYLGKNLSLAADWTPLRHIHDALGRRPPRGYDFDDPWQFKNFLIVEGM